MPGTIAAITLGVLLVTAIFTLLTNNTTTNKSQSKQTKITADRFKN